MKPKCQAVTDYWMEFYVNRDTPHSLCSLCGNTGQIDTRTRAISPRGIDAGRVNFCICPNGQAGRAFSMKTEV